MDEEMVLGESIALMHTTQILSAVLTKISRVKNNLKKNDCCRLHAFAQLNMQHLHIFITSQARLCSCETQENNFMCTGL